MLNQSKRRGSPLRADRRNEHLIPDPRLTLVKGAVEVSVDLQNQHQQAAIHKKKLETIQESQAI